MADFIPFDKRDGYIWLDGEIIPWQNATLHVLTHGLHYASCVFEGERCYNGKIFKGTEHTDRLFNSAEILDIDLPFTKDQINQAKFDILKKQNLNNAYLRAFAWRGSDMMAISAKENRTHMAIAAWDWPNYFTLEQKKQGIKLDISEWKRPSPECAPFDAKAAGLYMICTLSKHKAERSGYGDALMADYRGYVSEATGANIFFIKNGALHTPKPDCFLNGITRRTVIELAATMDIPVVERHITFAELPDFEACFLTGSAAEITPISCIKDISYNVDDLTMRFVTEYNDLVNGK